MRLFWISMGGLSVALGAIGIVLPLVPTTPFLLLAAYCFARSSPRMHTWLTGHPTLGPPIRHWHEHRAVSRATKWTALSFMGVVTLISLIMQVDGLIVAVQAIVLLGVSGFLLSRPEPP